MNKNLLDVAHDTAKGLHKIGLLDAVTMHEFDATCLPPVKKFTPKRIKSLRHRLNLSQSVFANYLNISPSTVKKWEIGTKHPSGAALKLLNLVNDKGLAGVL